MVDGQREENQGRRVIMDMVGPFLDSGRGVTGDNFFSSRTSRGTFEPKDHLLGDTEEESKGSP